MISITNKTACNGCHACVSVCPKKCILMKQDKEGFLYPTINVSECVSCGKCNKVCPLINDKTENNNALQIGFAAYAKNEKIRLASSSGGIFSLIAEQIIADGGVVVGATMNDDQKGVHHIIVDNNDELDKLRGSKYVQSIIGDTFVQTKEYLEHGRKVLFTGTPCQIGGLLSYLGKDYDNLYTQDLICHGVPSPLVWKKYVEYREKEASVESSSEVRARRTFFRVKPWKRFSVRFEFSNRTEYLADLRSDPFMQGFLGNIYLRPTCYNCKFKTKKRQSDLTLADFWGIQNIYSDMDDDKGTSYVWIHTEKGKKLWDCINGDTVYRECDSEKGIQIPAVRSVECPQKRKAFYKNIDSMDLVKNIKICTQKNIVVRSRDFVYRCIGSVWRRVKKVIGK